MEVEEDFLGILTKWILNCCILLTTIMTVMSCTKNSDIISANSEAQDVILSNEEYFNAIKEYSEADFAWTDSCKLNYLKEIDEYAAGSINLKGGSYLKIPVKSLIPPENLHGKNVKIRMAVKRDSTVRELDFTFGPHGCEFSEPVELCLSWKELHCKRATLYYLDESGNRVEHLADQVDYSNKRMILQIKHFSRYAVAYSN
jgi:hypothetical protein